MLNLGSDLLKVTGSVLNLGSLTETHSEILTSFHSGFRKAILTMTQKHLPKLTGSDLEILTDFRSTIQKHLPKLKDSKMVIQNYLETGSDLLILTDSS